MDEPSNLLLMLRGINIVLGVVVAGMSFTYMRWSDNRHQRARFIGLGLFALIFSLDTLYHFDQPPHPWSPFYLIALVTSIYGIQYYKRDKA